MSSTLSAQKLALYGLMFLPGFTWSTWVTRTPAIRDSLSASTEMMGIILFGFSCGSMVGIAVAGKLINVIGVRKAVLSSFMVLLMGLITLGAAIIMPSPVIAFIGLVLFGAGTGVTDIAINIEGAAFEQHISKPIMTTLHGFFSLGTLVGALAGMAMTALQISTTLHFAAALVVALLMLIFLLRRVPWVSENNISEQKAAVSYQQQVFAELRDSRLLLLGVVILAMALAEGSANDWLPLLMIDGHNFDHTTGTLVYVGFTAGMTLGRFAGGYLLNYIDRVVMLRFSAFSAALGLLLVIFSDAQWLAAAAVIFWGIGASLGFPLTISAAGEGRGNSVVRVTIAATLGYIAFLVGPPLLGFIGEQAGLRLAMLPVLVMVLLAFFCASAARSDKTSRV